MEHFDTLITQALALHASDVHISVGVPLMVRVNGALQAMNEVVYMPQDVEEIAQSVMSKSQQETLAQCGEVDFAYSIARVGRFRVNVFHQRNSLAMAIRILNLRIPSPIELGIPNAVVSLCDKKRGLVLVTGATGSGKSTTLASLIHVINQRHPHHIITLEEPIEYLHRHGKAVVNQREIGNDTKSYASALRAALRQDPDVILVGEMRDLETISIAVTAAETGHLVFSTLHTIGASNTIDRIIDVFPPYQQQQIRTQLAEVIEGIVSQQLIPCVGGEGRVAAMEVMLANSAVRSVIRDAKTYQIPSIMQTNRKIGMVTMDHAILDLYERGDIDEKSALMFAQDRLAMSKLLV